MNRADLNIYQGDDFGATVSVLQDGAPADLTGYTARAQIRQDVADRRGEVIAEITAAVSTSYILLSLTHEQTTALRVRSGRYVWDLEITSPDAQITTILAGGVTITSEVTR